MPPHLPQSVGDAVGGVVEELDVTVVVVEDGGGEGKISPLAAALRIGTYVL